MNKLVSNDIQNNSIDRMNEETLLRSLIFPKFYAIFFPSFLIRSVLLFDLSGNITAVFTYKVVGEQLARILDEEQIELNVSITPGKYGKPQNINR